MDWTARRWRVWLRNWSGRDQIVRSRPSLYSFRVSVSIRQHRMSTTSLERHSLAESSNPTLFLGPACSPLVGIEEQMSLVSQPFVGSSTYFNWLIYKAAQDAGVTVLLDGFDGDSVVSHGMEWLYHLSAEGEWTDVAREIVALSARTEVPTIVYVDNIVQPQLHRLSQAHRYGSLLKGVWELGRVTQRSSLRLLIQSFQRPKGERGCRFTGRTLDMLNPDFRTRIDESTHWTRDSDPEQPGGPPR